MFLRILFVASLAAAVACTANPVAPNGTSAALDGPVTVSGRVYATGVGSELPLVDATIDVVSNAASLSTHSGSRGFYSLAIPKGEATITASKAGFASKTWSVTMSENVVLNFTLASE